jgi:hypothetical protein
MLFVIRIDTTPDQLVLSIPLIHGIKNQTPVENILLHHKPLPFPRRHLLFQSRRKKDPPLVINPARVFSDESTHNLSFSKSKNKEFITTFYHFLPLFTTLLITFCFQAFVKGRNQVRQVLSFSQYSEDFY